MSKKQSVWQLVGEQPRVTPSKEITQAVASKLKLDHASVVMVVGAYLDEVVERIGTQGRTCNVMGPFGITWECQLKKKAHHERMSGYKIVLVPKLSLGARWESLLNHCDINTEQGEALYGGFSSAHAEQYRKRKAYMVGLDVIGAEKLKNKQRKREAVKTFLTAIQGLDREAVRQHPYKWSHG